MKESSSYINELHSREELHTRRRQAPALRGRNKPTCRVGFGAYQRRDTQVPPYEIIRNLVPAGPSTDPRPGPSRMPAPTSILIDGPYRRRNTRVPPHEIIRNPVPAGLRGLWPSHRNNAKHGLSALPHFFQRTAPNPIKNLNIKSFTRFFSKNRGGPGGSAPGRASQGAKSPPVATGETPPANSLYRRIHMVSSSQTQGDTKVTLSKRSRMPPWPGSSLP